MKLQQFIRYVSMGEEDSVKNVCALFLELTAYQKVLSFYNFKAYVQTTFFGVTECDCRLKNSKFLLEQDTLFALFITLTADLCVLISSNMTSITIHCLNILVTYSRPQDYYPKAL